MCTTAPVSCAACQNGARSGASSTLPTPRGSVPIMTPGKPAATAARSTSAAAAPSCSGTVASGTKRGSILAVAARWVLVSWAHAVPSAAGSS